MATEVLATIDAPGCRREYVLFDDGEGVKVWVHDLRYGVLETLPRAPEDPYEGCPE